MVWYKPACWFYEWKKKNYVEISDINNLIWYLPFLNFTIILQVVFTHVVYPRTLICCLLVVLSRRQPFIEVYWYLCFTCMLLFHVCLRMMCLYLSKILIFYSPLCLTVTSILQNIFHSIHTFHFPLIASCEYRYM